MPAAAARAQQAAVEARAVLLLPGNGGVASGGSSGQWAVGSEQYSSAHLAHQATRCRPTRGSPRSVTAAVRHSWRERMSVACTSRPVEDRRSTSGMGRREATTSRSSSESTSKLIAARDGPFFGVSLEGHLRLYTLYTRSVRSSQPVVTVAPASTRGVTHLRHAVLRAVRGGGRRGRAARALVCGLGRALLSLSLFSLYLCLPPKAGHRLGDSRGQGSGSHGLYCPLARLATALATAAAAAASTSASGVASVCSLLYPSLAAAL
eukprot:scaffold47110_cov50-Phaeocystis_antarctica.AAC.3